MSIICISYDYCYEYHNVYCWTRIGSYYLVDSGFPIGISLFPLPKLTRYHTQEFCSSNRQPSTKKELFNYKHSSLWMVIERSFGVLKAHFPILNLMPNFKRSRQRYVIVACCALYNFMCKNSLGDELFRTWTLTWVERITSSSLFSHNTEASSSTAIQRHVLEMSEAIKRLMI